MKRILVAAVIVAATTISGGARVADPPHALMPVPASLKFTAGRVPISTSTTVGVRGFADDRLRAAIQRAMRRLEGRTGYTMARALAADPAAATLVVECQAAGAAIPSLDEDESYSLTTA